MKDWFQKRLAEPSTYAGLSMVTLGMGQLAKVNEAPAIAQAIDAAAVPLSGGQWGLGLATIFGGLLAAFMREKGK